MKKGFTLLELILVISLLAILTSISIPRFGTSYKHVVFKQNVETIIEHIKFAQKTAVLTGKAVTIQIKDNQIITLQASLKINSGRIQQLPEDYELESSEREIRFFPDGQSDNYNISLQTPYVSANIMCENFSGDPILAEQDKK